MEDTVTSEGAHLMSGSRHPVPWVPSMEHWLLFQLLQDRQVDPEWR